MSKVSKTVNQIMEMSSAEEIIDLACRGLSPTKIAKETSLSRQHVTDVLNSYFYAYSAELAEKGEIVRLQSLMRLEYMFEKISYVALPEGKRGDEDFYPGDSQMMSIMLRIIKEIREWVKQERTIGEENQRSLVNIENVNVTMAASDPLYDVALGNMQDDWMKHADDDVNSIYQPDPEDGEIRSIEEKVERLERALPVVIDEDAEDVDNVE